MSISRKIIYNVSCKCGAKEIVESATDLTKKGWRINSNSYPVKLDTVKSVLCPACLETEQIRNYNSDDIRKRILGGYYQKNPGLWEKDLIKHLGIENHPKKMKILAYAWDRSHTYGHSEVLGTAEEIMEYFFND